jgi:putative endonuclease
MRPNRDPETGLQRRRRALKRGRLAETLAVWRLRLAGYRIHARNLRLPSGEIDILARRGAVLALVEVKARGDYEAASYALGARQRRRLARSGEAIAQRWPELASLGLRFDVVLIAPWRLPRHLADAWRPGAK